MLQELEAKRKNGKAAYYQSIIFQELFEADEAASLIPYALFRGTLLRSQIVRSIAVHYGSIINRISAHVEEIQSSRSRVFLYSST
jgi:hypothetical protein